MNTLHRQMALLTSSNERMIAEVGQLKKTYRGGSRTNAASCERNHLNMFHGLNDEGVCWYHAAWASNGRKYVNGCRQVETTTRVASGEYRSAVNLKSPTDNSGPSV